MGPELLAPAGNREAFEAAVAAGADAVYLGAGTFNARRNADNFSAGDLRAACRDAHLRGRRVYLTANTLVFEGEMDEALRTVSDAAEAGVDAAIVQDVGLMSVLRRELPGLELHTSTQMNIRDERGIELARRLGARRVTLARELSIERIAQLTRLGMPLEVFVHGALCICQSGQCLLSSMIGGRSANRGLCAQPCRLPYELVDGDGRRLADPGEYLLSPRDLRGIEVLDRLVASGVASLKIEGRMKSAEYVSTVVAAYRSALDRACATADGTYHATDAESSALSEAFSRGFTTAYLTGERGNAMMGYKRPNNRGVAVGRVSGFGDGLVKVGTDEPLEKGDLLEVWTSRGRVTHEVSDADDVRPGRVALAIAGRVSCGDRVFRIRSDRIAREQHERTARGMAIPVRLSVRMVEGRALRVGVRGTGAATGIEAAAMGPVVERARTKAVTREDVVAHVGRLGGTPYVCEDWDIELSEGVGMGFSALHKVRKLALESFERALLSARGGEALGTGRAAGADGSQVAARSAMQAVAASQRGRRRAAAPFATSIDFLDTVALDDAGIACELGDFMAGCAIGPRLYATNAEALCMWAQLGATFAWLSPELTLRQIADLAKDAPIPLGVVVSGYQELMVSDHCFLMAEGACGQRCATCSRRMGGRRYYKDRKGYLFPVATDLQGRGHLFNAVKLDVVHAVGELCDAGVMGFAIDTTLLEDDEAAGELERVHRALDGGRVDKEPNTTTGHLFRQVR